MMGEVNRAALRLKKGRDFRLVLDAKLIEVNEYLLSLHPVKDAGQVQETLTRYHALREFGDEVVATEEEDG